MVTAIIANNICTIMYYNRLRVLISYTLYIITRIVLLLCFPTHVSLQRVVYTVNGALLFLKRLWVYGHTYVILHEQVNGLETLQHKGCAYQCLYMQIYMYTTAQHWHEYYYIIYTVYITEQTKATTSSLIQIHTVYILL